MLTPDEATDAALRHGLSLTDAASLALLARDPEEADRIARRFATTQARP